MAWLWCWAIENERRFPTGGREDRHIDFSGQVQRYQKVSACSPLRLGFGPSRNRHSLPSSTSRVMKDGSSRLRKIQPVAETVRTMIFSTSGHVTVIDFCSVTKLFFFLFPGGRVIESLLVCG
ncbi:hypothetical protein RRG08_032700 [Elysia crispata]|uniref:Uncharacterized protein n=1 Tax=Elysia crispata TaxID=231223 RepID=A0AAE1D4Z9_9GAST|nr:hypothetical protein RRG08_032700 [Elysia crispata]